MRYLVVSDIHANLEALDAMLAAAGAVRCVRSCSAISSGYGADPNAVIDRVQALPGCDDHPRQPRQGRRGDRERRQLQPSGAPRHQPGRPRRSHPSTGSGWLRCRRGRASIDDLVEICHGSPFDEDVYIFDDLDAMRALRVARSRSACSVTPTSSRVIT